MESKLSSHPCVKPLYAFMCKILWDSVTAQKNKSSQMIDIILEVKAKTKRDLNIILRQNCVHFETK